MSILDIIIIIVFIASAAYGFWRGIVVQAGAIAGVITGILACRFLGPWATGFLSEILPELSSSPALALYINSVIANVVLFVVGYTLVRIIASMIKSVVHALFLGFVDRTLGALFSIFEWMLVLSLALNLWQAIDSRHNVVSSSTLANGKAAAAIMDLAPTVFGFAEMPKLF